MISQTVPPLDFIKPPTTNHIPLREPSKRQSSQRTYFIGMSLLALATVLFLALRVQGTAASPLITVPVVRQTLVQTATATGTVNPQNTVSVGTQVSGTIQELYVDYNTKVHKGQILARLDPSTFQAQLDQARASLEQAQAEAAAAGDSAQGAQSSITAAQAAARAADATAAAATANASAASAGISTADANLSKAQSQYTVAQQTVSRDRRLLPQGFIAQSQLDNDQANAVAAQSAVTAAQAAARQARLQAIAQSNAAQASTAQGDQQAAQSAQSVSQAAGSGASAQASAAGVQAAAAQVQQDDLNLQRSVIVSPIDGTVIARNVSVGQTVAASFQTPTLFTIAQNLAKMEVDIAVGESDIGAVKAGDSVDLSVLAYPNVTFHGSVLQVRESPTTAQNVVTYTVVTLVDNPAGRLRPGMTATASIHIGKAINALVVPLQALQWKPASSGLHRHSGGGSASSTSRAGARGAQQRLASAASPTSPWGQTAGGAGTALSAGADGVVFVSTGAKVRGVRVRIDLISGTQAAVTPVRGSLSPGDEIIISDGGQSANPAPRTAAQNPMGGLGRAMR